MTGQRLLILDDEPDFGAFVKRVAEDIGFEVTVLDRSTAFKPTYQEVQPDKIVLDIVMPDMDGVEIITWLTSVGNKAAVILVTGFGADYAKMATILATTNRLYPVTSLTKPMKLDDLRAALQAD